MNHKKEVLDFNPRTHRGVRQINNAVDGYFDKISIHAPIVGCDRTQYETLRRQSEISIHAPIVGCDRLQVIDGYNATDFNPRTHRGVRLHNFYNKYNYMEYFNPRTHRGVRLEPI